MHPGVEMKLNLDQLHGTGQCRSSNFPISLNGVAVTKRKQSALNTLVFAEGGAAGTILW